MIKVIIFVIAAITTVLQASLIEQIQAIEKCINVTGIDDFQVHEIGIELIISDDDESRAFIICLNDQLGFRGQGGEIRFNKIREFLDGLTSEEVETVINACQHIGTEDDSSYLVTKCLFREIRNILNL